MLVSDEQNKYTTLQAVEAPNNLFTNQVFTINRCHDYEVQWSPTSVFQVTIHQKLVEHDQRVINSNKYASNAMNEIKMLT